VSVIVDHTLLPTLKQFGAFDVGACFNCGNCTAVCPLSKDDTTFPRKIIRYAQWGCGTACSPARSSGPATPAESAPRPAPGRLSRASFMAAARRYAIASYDRTGLARTMYTRPVMGTLIAVFLAAFFAIFMAAGPRDPVGRVARSLRVRARGSHPHHRHRRDGARRAGRRRRARDDGTPGRAVRRRGLAHRARQPRGRRAVRSRPVGVDRDRVARPAALPGGVRRGQGRGPALPPPLAPPRAHDVGVPGLLAATILDMAWRCWESRQPARPCRSGTRSASWGRLPG